MLLSYVSVTVSVIGPDGRELVGPGAGNPDSVGPVGIHCQPHLPFPAQVINGQKHLIPGQLRTEVYDLFQWTFVLKLCQRGSDSLHEGSRGPDASLLFCSLIHSVLCQHTYQARPEQISGPLGDVLFLTGTWLAMPSALAWTGVIAEMTH